MRHAMIELLGAKGSLGGSKNLTLEGRSWFAEPLSVIDEIGKR